MFRPSPGFQDKLNAESRSSSTLPPEHRAFLDAARTGDTEKIRELLSKNVPVDVREDFCVHYMQNEQTALMYAAGGGHLEIVRLLLTAGSSVAVVDKMVSREAGGEQTALHYAARQKNVAVLEELLNAGADPNALTKNAWNRGDTPLNFALQANNPDAVRLLIQRGTNLSSKIGRKQAFSPLCAAVNASRAEVSGETIRDFVLQLLDAGADPNGVGDADQTAIFQLASTENLPQQTPREIGNFLIERLLKAGASPDSPDKFGKVPLLGALIRQNPGAVKLLLEAGADVNRDFGPPGTAVDKNNSDLAGCEKSLRELSESKPADEKAAGRHEKLRAVLEDKLQRSRQIAEILQKFGAKRKSELTKG
jgi:hypothetical protein